MKSYLKPTILFFIFCLPIFDATANNIVVIKSKNVAPYNQAVEGFKSDSKFKITEYLISPKKAENRSIIKEIKDINPDLLLTIGLNATLLIKEDFTNTPIMYCMVMNPEKHGLIDDKLSNIYGITLRITVNDQIQKMQTVLPMIKTMGVIYNPENTGHIIKNADSVVEKFGIKLLSVKVKSKKVVPKAIRDLIKQIDALWLIADATVVTRESFDFLLLSSFGNNMPIITHSERFVQAGALLSISPNYFDIGKQAARFTRKVLDYTDNKSDFKNIIPPDAANITINLKTAKKMGINIPEHVAKSSSKVFE